MPRKLTLYGYFRSSTSYRARIALHLKGLNFEYAPVHLLRDGGEHRKAAYRAINPQMRVPTLVVEEDDKRDFLIQSLAICEWLDEAYPNPPILPTDMISRAHCRAVASIIACDAHPLVNVGPINYLKSEFHASEKAIQAWYAKWVRDALAAIEQLIEPAPFIFGPQPTLADISIVPQMYNARRFDVPMDDFPKCLKVEKACLKHPAFAAASPERQPDAA